MWGLRKKRDETYLHSGAPNRTRLKHLIATDNTSHVRSRRLPTPDPSPLGRGIFCRLRDSSSQVRNCDLSGLHWAAFRVVDAVRFPPKSPSPLRGGVRGGGNAKGAMQNLMRCGGPNGARQMLMVAARETLTSPLSASPHPSPSPLGRGIVPPRASASVANSKSRLRCF